jgi:hypothetical protein
MAIPSILSTTAYCKNIIIKMAMMGEKSIPPADANPIRFRMVIRMGSVTRLKNWTMGFQGSGFTHDMTARIMTIHININKTVSRTYDNPIKIFPTINMIFP